MNITQFSVRNYQFTLIVFLMLALIGVNSMLNMPRGEDPDTEAPTFSAIILYPGTSPKDMEELVVFVVLVPVVLALEHPQPYHRPIHLAERLVIPLEFASIRKSFGIDYFKRFVENIQAGFVRILIRFAHAAPRAGTNSPTPS